MEKYFINYNTGAGDEWVEGDIEKAKSDADEGAAYTQQPIVITDESGKEVTRRNWWGVAYDPNEAYSENPIQFGSFGYYDDWAED